MSASRRQTGSVTLARYTDPHGRPHRVVLSGHLLVDLSPPPRPGPRRRRARHPGGGAAAVGGMSPRGAATASRGLPAPAQLVDPDGSVRNEALSPDAQVAWYARIV